MVIAYLRVSTNRQHLENQREEILHYSKNKKIKIDRWCSDTISGTKESNKRKLGKVLRGLKKGDTLIVTELSRLSRSMHEIMTIMKHCVERHVEVYSTKDGYTFDDSTNSKVLSFAFGLTAELERKLISQRTREAMAVHRANGKHMGRFKGTGEKIRVLWENRSFILTQIEAGKPLVMIARQLGVSYYTLHRFRKMDVKVEQYIMNRNNKRNN